MSEIRNILLQHKNGYTIFSADFQVDLEKTNLWFRTKAVINPVPEVFLACTFIPAMKIGGSLRYDQHISPVLSNSLHKIQNILCSWYPDELKKIPFQILPNEERISQPQKKVACFFTGGVDSFYTLLKHKEEITTIVYVHGFDLWLHETEFREMTANRIREIAKQFGKELIEVETNLLYFSHKICDWASQYYGSALASVALLLSNTIGKIYIASSLNTEVLYPRGSHPDLDHLWNTEEIEIIHDGCESTRLNKVKVISKNEIALNNLRVCLDRRWGLYNCSKCEKCVRTMLSLYISGVLDQSKTFEHSLTPELILSLGMTNNSLIFARENYNELSDGELKEALKKKIDEYQHL